MDNIEIKSLENEIQILEDLLLSKKEQLHELKSKAKVKLYNKLIFLAAAKFFI